MKNLSCLTVVLALGGLSHVSAAVIPADAGFGGRFVNETGLQLDQIAVGVPNITPFNGPSASSGGPSSSVVAGTTYTYELTYASGATKALTFTIKNGATTVLQASDSDFYGELAPGIQANISGLRGFYVNLFGFTPQGNPNPNWFGGLPSLTGGDVLGAPTLLPGSTPTDSLYFFPATGLSDGFTYTGDFNFTTDVKGAGFAIYAAVPEPATVAFGLAMVGGLGLLEIRRRKNS